MTADDSSKAGDVIGGDKAMGDKHVHIQLQQQSTLTPKRSAYLL